MQLYSLKPKLSFYLAVVAQINVIMAMLPTKYCKDSTSLLKFHWLPFLLASLTLEVRTDNGEPKIVTSKIKWLLHFIWCAKRNSFSVLQIFSSDQVINYQLAFFLKNLTSENFMAMLTLKALSGMGKDKPPQNHWFQPIKITFIFFIN